MSVHSQIDLYNKKPAEGVKPAARIHDGWGVPKDVLGTLQALFNKGRKSPQVIANGYVQLSETGFAKAVINRDLAPDVLSYHYAVDLTTTPWSVKVTKCPYHRVIDNGDGTGCVESKVQPARTRTVKLAATA